MLAGTAELVGIAAQHDRALQERVFGNRQGIQIDHSHSYLCRIVCVDKLSFRPACEHERAPGEVQSTARLRFAGLLPPAAACAPYG